MMHTNIYGLDKAAIVDGICGFWTMTPTNAPPCLATVHYLNT